MLVNKTPGVCSNFKETTLTVIVPVYNTPKKYLERCLNSIINQTYKEIEIIIIDDGSDTNTKEILKKCENATVINHDRNYGLLKARITGIKSARSKYICFLDSDDFVTPDFYRTLICEAEKNNWDIVAGSTVFENSDEKRKIRPMHDLALPQELHGSEVYKKFFNQHGRCFAWHTVWNKIYRSSLFDRIMPDLDSITEHIVMTEDILLSSLIFLNAKSFTSIRNEGYVYCSNTQSSTKSQQSELSILTNIKDVCFVFNFIQGYIEKQDLPKEILKDFNEFRKTYSRRWRTTVMNFQTKNRGALKKSVDLILPGYDVQSTEDDYLFEKIELPYDESIEHLKIQIVNSTAPIVFKSSQCTFLGKHVSNNRISNFKGDNTGKHVITLLELSMYLKKRVIIVNDTPASIDELQTIVDEKINYENCVISKSTASEGLIIDMPSPISFFKFTSNGMSADDYDNLFSIIQNDVCSELDYVNLHELPGAIHYNVPFWFGKLILTPFLKYILPHMANTTVLSPTGSVFDELSKNLPEFKINCVSKIQFDHDVIIDSKKVYVCGLPKRYTIQTCRKLKKQGISCKNITDEFTDLKGQYAELLEKTLCDEENNGPNGKHIIQIIQKNVIDEILRTKSDLKTLASDEESSVRKMIHKSFCDPDPVDRELYRIFVVNTPFGLRKGNELWDNLMLQIVKLASRTIEKALSAIDNESLMCKYNHLKNKLTAR